MDYLNELHDSDTTVNPTPPPARSVNGGQDGGLADVDFSNPEDVASIHKNYRLPSVASHISHGHHER